MTGVSVEGEGIESELLGSLLVTVDERADLVVFVIDGGRTLKPVFLPKLKFSLFSFMLVVFNRVTFS